MGWELHAIAFFAGHRSTESTLKHIHLSVRDLADKLAKGMDQIHAWRVEQLTAIAIPRGGPAVTSAFQVAAARVPDPGWSLKADADAYDRSAALTVPGLDALQALGWGLRRWPHHWTDPARSEWHALRRLIVPLAAAREHLEVPEENDFQRRFVTGAVALVLRGCAPAARASGPGTPRAGRRSSALAARRSRAFTRDGRILQPGPMPSPWPDCSASPN